MNATTSWWSSSLNDSANVTLGLTAAVTPPPDDDAQGNSSTSAAAAAATAGDIGTPQAGYHHYWDTIMANGSSSNISSNSSSSILPVNQSQGFDPLVTIMDYPAFTEIYIFVCCLVWLLCVVGNVIVLTVMTRSPSIRTRTNLFLCHLAIADLSVGLVCIVPDMVVAAKVFYWFPDPAGRVVCKVYNFFEEFSLTASVLLLVLIAAERYVAILHPLKARQLFTRCKMYTSLIAVWTAAVVYNVPLLMIYETATIDDGHTYCYRFDTDRQAIRMDIYHVSTFLLTYLAPLLLMGTMYLRVSLTLWKSSPVSLLQASEREVGAVHLAGRGAPQTGGGEVKMTEHEAKATGGESRNSSITSHTSHTSCSSGSGSAATAAAAAAAAAAKTNHSKPGGADTVGASTGTSAETYGVTAVPDASRPLLLACRSPDAAIIGNAATAAGSCRSGVRRVAAGDASRGMVPSSASTVPLILSASHHHHHHHGGGGGNGGHGTTLPSLNTGRMRDGVYAIRSAANNNYTNNSRSNNNSRSGNGAATSYRYQVTAHRVLQARRKVIRLLVAVLLVFACCVLPFHVKLLLRYGLKVRFVDYPVGLVDFVSQLLFFLNSALNPVLYSLMSQSFRRSARQVLCCRT